MSRHLLLDRPDRQVVLGYDHMLLSFFGQVMRRDRAVDGWPTKSGLGTRRPVRTAGQAAEDVAALTEWAKRQIGDAFASEPMAADHLGLLIGMLLRERSIGEDLDEVPLPDCLTGARP